MADEIDYTVAPGCQHVTPVDEVYDGLCHECAPPVEWPEDDDRSAIHDGMEVGAWASQM